jgi:hypothetical protein
MFVDLWGSRLWIAHFINGVFFRAKCAMIVVPTHPHPFSTSSLDQGMDVIIGLQKGAMSIWSLWNCAVAYWCELDEISRGRGYLLWQRLNVGRRKSNVQQRHNICKANV